MMNFSLNSHTLRLFILLLALAGVVSLSGCVEASAAAQQRPDIPGSNPVRGRQAIQEYGCGSCHNIPGVTGASAWVGPPLNNWAERQYIAGNLTNTLANLIRWIQEPQAVEPGTVMPDMGVTDQDARDIAAYLYTLEDN